MRTSRSVAAIAENRLQLQLAPTAQVIGWDVTALGLTAAKQPFVRGEFTQHVELLDPTLSHSPWLERGRIAAEDTRLLQSPLGLAGHSVLVTVFFIAGRAISTPTKELFLSQSREIITAHSLAQTTGLTCPQQQVIVLRALAHDTEAAMNLCHRVRSVWRQLAWGLEDEKPRIWTM